MTNWVRRRFLSHCTVLLLAGFASLPCRAGEPLRVAAAISLKEALTEIADDWNRDHSPNVELVFGSSGQLLSQARGGAAIDIFISAASEQIDALRAENLLADEPPRILAANRLALVTPAGAELAKAVRGFEDLAGDSVRRIAIGEPRTVPAGMYARQSLTRLNLLDRIESRIIYGASVRQVLDYVTRGEVQAALVYITDAQAAGDKVRLVATVDAALHDPIVYPAVILRRSRDQQTARELIDALLADPAQRVLRRHGFAAPESAASQPATNPAAVGAVKSASTSRPAATVPTGARP